MLWCGCPYKTRSSVHHVDGHSVKLPNLVSPCVELPNLVSPCVELPNLVAPCVELPNLVVPCVELPNLVSPCVELPNLVAPCVELRNLVSPCVELSKLNMQYLQRMNYVFKGTVSRDLDILLYTKNSTWAPCEQAKTVSQHSFLRRYLQKTCISVVVDYADTRFSNFVIAKVCENEKIRDTILACSCGAQIESNEPKNRSRKSRDTVPSRLRF